MIARGILDRVTNKVNQAKQKAEEYKDKAKGMITRSLSNTNMKNKNIWRQNILSVYTKIME